MGQRLPQHPPPPPPVPKIPRPPPSRSGEKKDPPQIKLPLDSTGTAAEPGEAAQERRSPLQTRPRAPALFNPDPFPVSPPPRVRPPPGGL